LGALHSGGHNSSIVALLAIIPIVLLFEFEVIAVSRYLSVTKTRVADGLFYTSSHSFLSAVLGGIGALGVTVLIHLEISVGPRLGLAAIIAYWMVAAPLVYIGYSLPERTIQQSWLNPRHRRILVGTAICAVLAPSFSPAVNFRITCYLHSPHLYTFFICLFSFLEPSAILVSYFLKLRSQARRKGRAKSWVAGFGVIATCLLIQLGTVESYLQSDSSRLAIDVLGNLIRITPKTSHFVIEVTLDNLFGRKLVLDKRYWLMSFRGNSSSSLWNETPTWPTNQPLKVIEWSGGYAPIIQLLSGDHAWLRFEGEFDERTRDTLFASSLRGAQEEGRIDTLLGVTLIHAGAGPYSYLVVHRNRIGVEERRD